MDFGRVEDPKLLALVSQQIKAGTLRLPRNDFTFSQSKPHPENNKGRKPRVYVGPPVWSHPGWVGTLYPKKTPSKDFLKHFSRLFNAIELNSTFYRTPSAKTLSEWKLMTPAEFRFSPKLNQAISHTQTIPGLITDFCETMKALGDRLGVSFLQLPPNFSRNQLPTLRAMLQAVPKKYALAVEFRHPSWFVAGKLSQDIADFLSDREMSTVITDALGRADVLHSTLTSRSVMVRFLANEMHESDFGRIDLWVKKIGTWIEAGVEEIYFYPHLHGYDRLPELTSDLISKLNDCYDLGLNDWKKNFQASDRPDEQEQPRLL
jgi:uncharacterized protein YecE (DUF72 family)